MLFQILVSIYVPSRSLIVYNSNDGSLATFQYDIMNNTSFWTWKNKKSSWTEVIYLLTFHTHFLC